MDSDSQKNNRSNAEFPETQSRIKRVPNEGIFMSVSKKAEKITTALYMVTDFIRDEDPMRHRIRSLSLSIMSDTRGLSYAMTGDLYFHLARIISNSWEIMSLMEVSVVVGFISDMNYKIIKGALIDFISDLRNRQKMESLKNIHDMKLIQGEAGYLNLKSDFFKLGEEDYLSFENEKMGYELSPDKEKKMIDQSKKEAKENIKMSDINFIKDIKKPIENKSINAGRKDRILDLIKEKGDISIKDIVDYFKDVGQKTIQRDLIALVEEGKLKKQGEKRWSRYSPI